MAVKKRTPDEDVVAIFKRVVRTKPRLYAMNDPGRVRDDSALSIMTTWDRAYARLPVLRHALPAGWLAFIGNFTCDWRTDKAELVVGKGVTQFDILRLAQSEAPNFGLETEDLISTLRKWDKKYGIDIFQASTDTVGVGFTKLGNVLELARGIRKFCPDVVAQGLGSVGALVAHLRKHREISLWWD